MFSPGSGEVDVSVEHHGVGKDEEMWSVLVGDAEDGAGIRDANLHLTPSTFEVDSDHAALLEDAKIHNKHRGVSPKARDKGSTDDAKGDLVVERRVRVLRN